MRAGLSCLLLAVAAILMETIYVTVGAATPAPLPGTADPALARSDYIENCGGCHGVTGSTAPAKVPELRGRVGYFLCTPETRAYLLRLPNVAHSRVRDNEQLAGLMNYVVYVLGEGSVPPGRTAPFTADEVAQGRLHALSSANLTRERARNVAIVMRQCHAPASLRDFYTPMAAK
ncbi:cytochrome C [Sphingobium sp. Sx8-8]|uniref:c-type cytochrome n=1 Tax=Sphingobium sp. Sx8-8 TaxID=2933617 RepID=UPI001F581099|nr:cytochrome C [Sphingobium sp. Sx8-8]